MKATSKKTYEVRPATTADVKALRGKLRVADYEEVRAATGNNADDALAFSLDASRFAWTGVFCGRPILVFGVAAPSELSLRGVPWMLGTDEVETVGIAVVRRSRHYVQEMKRPFDRLENFTDDRHKSSHAWLKWCGFTVEEPAPWGVENKLFRRFWLE